MDALTKASDTGSIFSSFNCRVITKYFWMSFSRFWLKMLNLIILVITQILSREYQPTSIFQRNLDAFMNFTMYYDVMSLHFWWGHYQAILVIMAWLKSLHAFLLQLCPAHTYLPSSPLGYCVQYTYFILAMIRSF